MSKWVVDIHGEIEGDYELIKKYEEPKTGHWIDTNSKDFEFHSVYKCSECGLTEIEYPEGMYRFKYCPNCGAKMVGSQGGEEISESIDKVDNEPDGSKFKCKAEQGGWCERWERECVSWEHCELSSYNFPCPGCVASSPLEREECDSCKWKDEKQKHYIYQTNE